MKLKNEDQIFKSALILVDSIVLNMRCVMELTDSLKEVLGNFQTSLTV